MTGIPDRTPAEVFHPSVFIEDELKARGWTRDMLAMRMGPEFGIHRLSLDFYLDCCPTEPDMRRRASAYISWWTAYGPDGKLFGPSPNSMAPTQNAVAVRNCGSLQFDFRPGFEEK